jgi:N-acetylmuramoyl-L-alanine amidase
MRDLIIHFFISISFVYHPIVYATASPSGLATTIRDLSQKSIINKTVFSPLLKPKATIVIDPGHGGHDVGTQSLSKPLYQEKSFNLVTAQFVKGYLQQLGYQVIMTRENDTFISLEQRVQLANEHKPSLFVSIHYNSAPNTKAQGVEVFFYPSKDDKKRVIESKQLAQILLKNVLEQTEAKSRGVKSANYFVIRETKMAAILIEGGFLTNELELNKLKDPLYLKQLAWGITKGIEEYLQITQTKAKKRKLAQKSKKLISDTCR